MLSKIVLTAAREVANFFKGDLSSSITILKDNFSRGLGIISGLFTDFEGTTSGIVTLIKSGLANLGNAIGKTLVDTVSGALDSIKGFFRDLGSSILGSL